MRSDIERFRVDIGVFSFIFACVAPDLGLPSVCSTEKPDDTIKVLCVPRDLRRRNDFIEHPLDWGCPGSRTLVVVLR